jgi:hypothetical protein
MKRHFFVWKKVWDYFQMEKCEQDVLYIIGFIASSILFLSSEIIGSSSCDAGGVFSFCFHGYNISIKGCGVNTAAEEAEEAVDEVAPLLN